MEWKEVRGSTRVVAEAYSPETRTIYVRFPDGTEWFYGNCTYYEWEMFRSGSRGGYILNVLNHKPNGPMQHDKD